MDRFGEQELIELTNLDDPTATTIDDLRLERTLISTDAEINAYIQGSTDPIFLPILVEKAIDIARYKLESRGEPREDVRKRYEDATAYLEKVSEGKIKQGSQGVMGSIAFNSAPRVFTKSIDR